MLGRSCIIMYAMPDLHCRKGCSDIVARGKHFSSPVLFTASVTCTYTRTFAARRYNMRRRLPESTCCALGKGTSPATRRRATEVEVDLAGLPRYICGAVLTVPSGEPWVLPEALTCALAERLARRLTLTLGRMVGASVKLAALSWTVAPGAQPISVAIDTSGRSSGRHAVLGSPPGLHWEAQGSLVCRSPV